MFSLQKAQKLILYVYKRMLFVWYLFLNTYLMFDTMQFWSDRSLTTYVYNNTYTGQLMSDDLNAFYVISQGLRLKRDIMGRSIFWASPGGLGSGYSIKVVITNCLDFWGKVITYLLLQLLLSILIWVFNASQMSSCMSWCEVIVGSDSDLEKLLDWSLVDNRPNLVLASVLGHL